MGARRMQLIRVSDEQVVLKRGVHELLVSGPEAAAVVDAVVDGLSGAADLDEILAGTPESLRPAAEQLLGTLRARRLVDDVPAAPDGEADSPQRAFFSSLDVVPEVVQATLRSATLAVFGINRTSRSLVHSLLQVGLGTVRAFSHPVLDNHEVAQRWPADFTGWIRAGRLPSAPDTGAALGAAELAAELTVATCDFGRAAALLDVNRRAVASGAPFLPVWLEESAAFVGPLAVPRETACLRCFVDGRDGPGRVRSGPPVVAVQPPGAPDDLRVSDSSVRSMAAICGRIAAMEALKFLTGCAPSGAVGRSLEVDPRTSAMSARRVFKLPRCPDCSEIARHRVPSVLEGPQIPHR